MSVSTDTSDLAGLVAFAHELADAAGREILPRFRVPIAVANKHKAGGFDPVTEADRAAEIAMRALVKARRPGDGILGEELGHEPGTGPFTWVFDPIDGTRAFMAGLPVWGTLIALLDGDRPVLGVLDQPFLGERFLGHDGHAELRSHGATTTLRSRSDAALKDAILCATTPDMFKGEEIARFGAVAARARLTRYGTDCYAYGMLAAGFVDLVIEASLKPYDILAHIPIVEGAGGIVTNWQGGPAYAGGRCIAAANKAIHAEALAILAG
ncbi:MAG: histidinol-phosphatase [Alphaproteobacteria bacterium]|nr:histidinol-phosphatase [Alphaproteobacteria bacterium]